MTDEELIKLSRENLRKSRQGSLCECYDEAFIKGYKLSEKRIVELEKENAGLKVGRLKWHDLQKNPKDLPEKGVEVLNENGDKVRYDGTGFSGWITYSDYEERDVEVDAPIAWCEVPTFNTWLHEDEVKEE